MFNFQTTTMDKHQTILKRKPLSDETQLLQLQPITKVERIPKLLPNFIQQIVHSMLVFNQHDLITDTISHDSLSRLLAPENELELLQFLSQAGVIAHHQVCNFCGGTKHFHTSGKPWYWICARGLLV